MTHLNAGNDSAAERGPEAASGVVDLVLNGSSLRAILVANMHDGDEGGVLTMSVPALLNETIGLVGEWLADGAVAGE